MRKLTGYKWICVFAMLSSVAQAQVKIVIDNQTIPTEDIASITILKNTNEINIATTRAYNVAPVVVGTNAAITSFIATPGTIVAGSSTTVSWNTANATSCTATGGVGGWAGSNIAVPSGSKDIITSTTGTHTFTLTCLDASGGSAVANTTVTVNAANAVAITNFTVSPSTITEGGSTTISWDTENATACTPSGGTGGWSATNLGLPTGNTTITATTAGTYVFTLTCQDASSGAVSSNRSLIVQSGTVDSQCDPVPLSGVTTNWEDFWSSAFPFPGSETRYMTIPIGGYTALEFNTAAIVDEGKISSIETTITDGLRLGSISECPGDFDVPALCTHLWGIGGGIRWATNGREDACQLKPNTNYYFNITFTDGVDSNSSSCRQSPCVTYLQHSNR